MPQRRRSGSSRSRPSARPLGQSGERSDVMSGSIEPHRLSLLGQYFQDGYRLVEVVTVGAEGVNIQDVLTDTKTYITYEGFERDFEHVTPARDEEQAA
jgi:hypothetical protein